MKKKMILITAIVLLVLLLTPIKAMYDDGGTITYTAVLYKIIVWHKITFVQNEGVTEKKVYKTGTDFYIFPFNFMERAKV